MKVEFLSDCISIYYVISFFFVIDLNSDSVINEF